MTNFNHFVSRTDSPKDQKLKKLTTSNSFSSGTDSPNDYGSKGSTYFKPFFSKTKQQKSKCHESSNIDHKSKKLTTFNSFSSGKDSPNDYKSKGSTYFKPLIPTTKQKKSNAITPQILISAITTTKQNRNCLKTKQRNHQKMKKMFMKKKHSEQMKKIAPMKPYYSYMKKETNLHLLKEYTL